MNKLMMTAAVAALALGTQAEVIPFEYIGEYDFDYKGDDGYSADTPDQPWGYVTDGYGPEHALDNAWLWTFGEGEFESTAVNPAMVKKYADKEENYLHIETDVDPLERTFSNMNDWMGEAQSVEIGKVFIDTDVKFTATTEAPELDADAQFALWLKESQNEDNQNVYQLMVTCGSIYGELLDVVSTNVALDVTVNNDEWHHVKITPVLDSGTYGQLGLFSISIDGKQVATKDPQAVFQDEGYTYFLSPDHIELTKEGKLFPSRLRFDEPSSGLLTSIAFQGTGDIDNLKISDEDTPEPPPVKIDYVTFTINKGEGVASVEVATNGEAVVDLDGVYTVESNATVTVTATLADDYENPVYTYNDTPFTEEGFEASLPEGVVAVTATKKQGGEPTPVVPGKPQEVTAENEEAAKKQVEFKAPDEVAENLDETKLAAYEILFEKKAVNKEGNTWVVSFELTEKAEGDLQKQVDEAEKIVDGIAEGEATITATPGIYYTVIADGTIKGMKPLPDTCTLATDTTVTLELPKFENAGFYQIEATVEPIKAPEGE